jgi:hypothetical protein
MGKVVFEHWLSGLTNEETEICKVISHASKPINIKKLKLILIENESMINLHEVERYIHDLKEKDVLQEVAPYAIKFKDRLFELYVEREPPVK